VSARPTQGGLVEVKINVWISATSLYSLPRREALPQAGLVLVLDLGSSVLKFLLGRATVRDNAGNYRAKLKKILDS